MAEPTRAELADEVAALKGHLQAAITERDRWREMRRQDPEAEALEACVRALDKLRNRPTGSQRFGPAASEVERILLYLANRYGASLIRASDAGLGWVTDDALQAEVSHRGLVWAGP